MAFALISGQTALLFLIVSILFGMLLSMSAVALEELTKRRYPSPVDLARLFAAALIENLGFRQLLTIWRTRGLLDGIRKVRKGWGVMERRGFASGAIVFLCLSLTIPALAQEDVVARARQLATHGHRREALQILEQRIATTRDVDALVLYGTVLSWERDLDRARRALKMALVLDPENRDASDALARVQQWSSRTTAPTNTRSEVVFGGTYDDFQNSDPWREAEISVKKNLPFGAITVRGAHARRFGLDDDQIELEAYPKISAKGYAYLNAGYSPHERLYPRSRFGAEFFEGFGPGFEASLGYRRLNFSSAVNVYTASLSKYLGDWLLTLRGYRSGGTNSLQAMIRRYLATPENYVGVRFGKGSTRDEIRSVTDIQTLDSVDFAAEGRFVIRDPWSLQIRAGTGRQRLSSSRNQRHSAASALLGIKF